MLDELKKSISATLYERLTSPLIGSYVVSWCLWNYKVFLIILSSLEYDEKIERIDAHFSGWECLSAFSIPLIVAAFYIFLYPCIAKYVFKIWQKYIADMERIRQNVKREIPITKKQAGKLRQDIAKQSIEFENRLNDKNERIKLLEDRDKNNLTRIEEKDKEISQLKDQVHKLNTELTTFYDRKRLIEDYNIIPDQNGLMRSNKHGVYQGLNLCPSCLNASPPKLIPLPKPERIPHNQQFIKCPSCNGEYLNPNYQPEANSKKPVASVDDEFLCWYTSIDKKKTRYCPICAIRKGELKLAELAKVSENEYKCVLCSKSYSKTHVSTA